MEACRAYPLRPWEKLTFEYVLLKNVNDTDADARRVVQLLARLNAKVNLIRAESGSGDSIRDSRSRARRVISGDHSTVAAVFYSQTARLGRVCGMRPVKTDGDGGAYADSVEERMRRKTGRVCLPSAPATGRTVFRAGVV